MSTTEERGLEPSASGADHPVTHTVTAINLKIPPFWPADPEIWFAQVEAQFTTRGISAQKTKFDHIIASLSPEVAVEVRDLILNVPKESPYDELKFKLIHRTAVSEQRRLQQLLNTKDLGDRKPSQLLRRMQQLLGEKYSSTVTTFLRELFLQRLPSHVRMVLASIESKDLASLALTADNIVEVSLPPIGNITQSAPSEFDQLKNEVSELRKMVETLVTAQHRRQHSRTPRPRSSSPSPRAVATPSTTICWYHQRFGSDAQKCHQPCTYSGNGPASSN